MRDPALNIGWILIEEDIRNVCMRVCTHEHKHRCAYILTPHKSCILYYIYYTCSSQRTTCEDQLSPSTLWILWRLLDLPPSTFTWWAISLILKFFCNIPRHAISGLNGNSDLFNFEELPHTVLLTALEWFNWQAIETKHKTLNNFMVKLILRNLKLAD